MQAVGVNDTKSASQLQILYSYNASGMSLYRCHGYDQSLE
mgnify:CR=1 FL=1